MFASLKSCIFNIEDFGVSISVFIAKQKNRPGHSYLKILKDSGGNLFLATELFLIGFVLVISGVFFGFTEELRRLRLIYISKFRPAVGAKETRYYHPQTQTKHYQSH